MDLFEPIGKDLRKAEEIRTVSLTYWQDVSRRFFANKVAVCSLFVLCFLLIMSIIGPWISGRGYAEICLEMHNQPPSSDYWFGTDDLGRDMFTRIWYGARISLFIGITAATIDLVIGILWGGLAGLLGGRTDEVMMRIADILYAVPYLLVVIMIMVVMNPGLLPIIIAMSMTGWIGMARIVRGQILQLKAQEYVLAAQALGASTGRILFKHLIPNAMGPIIVTVTISIPTAIFVEAFLSFLGMGVPAPMASWGTMANDGLSAMKYYPWRLAFPAFFISLTMLSFNLLGDGLRDALDPKLRRS